MAIHNLPHYRYALFDPWDKEAFVFIRQIAKNKNYPKLLGTQDDKNKYLIALIRTQKSLRDWRDFLKDTIDHARQTGTIDTKSLVQKYPPESVSNEVPAWVTYKEDRIVNDFIDSLATKQVTFHGNDNEMSEFIMRFILGQLSDWETTIMMIWEMLGDGDSLNIKQLNKEMKNFDYLGLFK